MTLRVELSYKILICSIGLENLIGRVFTFESLIVVGIERTESSLLFEHKI